MNIQETNSPIDQVSMIIAYEQGDLDCDEVVQLFQSLIDTGLAWELQGHYGRVAESLINAGYCNPRKFS